MCRRERAFSRSRFSFVPADNAKEVEGVLFVGDLFHAVGTIATECLNTVDVFFKSIQQLNIPIYFVKGNHDIVNRKNPQWFHYSGRIFDQSECPDNIKLIHFHEEIDYEAVKGYDMKQMIKRFINCFILFEKALK